MWGAWIAGEGEVNATVSRLMVGSMMGDPQDTSCNHAYVRGHAFVVSATEIAEAIGILLVDDAFYSIGNDEPLMGVSWDEFVGMITGERLGPLPMLGKVQPDDLTADYRALWLALTACMVGLRMDQIRFLYVVGAGRLVCLERIYVLLAMRATATTKMPYIKGKKAL